METNKREMKKQNTKFVAFLFLIVLSVGFASAITGSIGNARMILRAETGETIERSILVKNVNDVALDIEISPSGDLEKDITIIDYNFSLAPNSEKKAYFKIDIKNDGTTESAINVKFTPKDGGNGVGLASTIIVIAQEGEGWWETDDEDEGVDEDNVNNSISVITGSVVSNVKDAFNKLGLAFVILVLIFFVLVGVFIFMLRGLNKPKKSSVLDSE